MSGDRGAAISAHAARGNEEKESPNEVAVGSDAEPEECKRALAETVKLVDEVGPERASRLRCEWAWAQWDETGVCPWCGERGPYHDPERSEEDAP